MFEVRVNGQVVYKEEAQVDSVALMSARGELYRAGMTPQDGVIDVVLHRVTSGSPIRLDQLEAFQRQQQASFVEGQLAGERPYEVSHDMRGDQGAHDNTLRPGGVESNPQQPQNFGPPTRDLAEGLDPRDHETRTARLEAYAQHGDADRAISDNPGQDAATTAEQGATPENTVSTSPADNTPPTEEQQAQADTQPEETGQVVTDGETPAPPPETTPAGNPGATPQSSVDFGFGLSDGATGGSGPTGPTPPSEDAQSSGGAATPGQPI